MGTVAWGQMHQESWDEVIVHFHTYFWNSISLVISFFINILLEQLYACLIAHGIEKLLCMREPIQVFCFLSELYEFLWWSIFRHYFRSIVLFQISTIIMLHKLTSQ